MANRANILSYNDAKRTQGARRSRSSARARGSAVQPDRYSRRPAYGDSLAFGSYEPVQYPRRPSSERASRSYPNSPRPSRANRLPSKPSWYEELDDASASFDMPGKAPAPFFQHGGTQEAQPAEERNQGPRSAVTRFDKEESEEEGRGLISRFKKLRHSAKKTAAERKFDKQFGGADAPAGEGGPRAAVYKGEMGSTHRRSARMQDEGVQGSSRASGKRSKEKKSLLFSALKMLVCSVVVVAVLYNVLYTPAQQYYLAQRSYDQKVAELEAVNQRNDALNSEVENLSTDEGIEARAHADYGWVSEDENSVMVQGLTSSSSHGEATANVVPGSVAAPQTWYSPVLDVFFGYNQ